MFPGGKEFGGHKKVEFVKKTSYSCLYFLVRHVKPCLTSVRPPQAFAGRLVESFTDMLYSF